MPIPEDPQQIGGEDARGGERTRRWPMAIILGASLALIIVAFAVLMLYYR